MPQRRSLIALGSNLSYSGQQPSRILDEAVTALRSPGIHIAAVSSHYATPSKPAGSGPDFVNAAIAVTSGLPPAALLARLHGIEARMGRERSVRWGPRTIDLDLIAAGDAVLPDRATWAEWAELPADQQTVRAPDELILPHPRLQDRAFVLVPLVEIAPDWVHPVLGMSATALLDALPEAERTEIRRLAPRA